MLLTKKDKPLKGGELFKFDGFQFIEQNPDIPSNLSPQFFAAWKHAEALSTKSTNNGMLFIYDLNTSVEKPKFKVECLIA